MARVEDMLHKMMRRFDANDEDIKELRSELGVLGIKSIHMQYRSSRSSLKWPIIYDYEHTETGHSS